MAFVLAALFACRLPTVEDADGDGFGVDSDCNDNDRTVFPGASEHCNGVDEDCNGVSDDDAVDATDFYFDADGDTYGDAANPISACEGQPAGSTSIGLDCDDSDPAIHPDVLEGCDDTIDSDCSGRPSNGCDVEFLPSGGSFFQGMEVWDELGRSVANAGDLDGDGADDVALVAPYFGEGGAIEDTQGAAYVVYGNDDTYAGDIDGAYDARVTGEAEGTLVGEGVKGVGDLDGDGYDDLLVQSWVWPGSGYYSGNALVFSGPLHGELAVRDADVNLIYDMPGTDGTVSRGDFDGDGQADIVTGSGADRVLFFSGPIDGKLDSKDASARLEGDEQSLAGIALSTLEDDDGDGLADIAIGAPMQNDDAGAVLVAHGPFDENMTSASADATYTSSGHGKGGYHYIIGDTLGWRCAWAGDLDGDGHLELAMSAIGADENGHNAGAVYVVYGPHITSIDVRDADAVVYGGETSTSLGWGLAGGADLDADGFEDLLVGDYNEFLNDWNSGAAFLFYGPMYGRRSSRSADIAFAGGSSGAQAGTDIDVLDFDGDGGPDLVIGAPLEALNGSVSVVPNTAF